MLLAFLACAGLAGVGFNVVWKARMMARYHSRMKTALRKLYSRTVDYPEVDLVEFGVADNPAVVKYSRELEAIGGRHLIDVRIDPATSSRSCLRLFQFPSDHTYVFLNIMLATQTLHFYPANSFLLVKTFFADGSCLTSSNAKGTGYRKLRRANMTYRHFVEAKNPGDLLTRHRQVLNRLLGEGRRLAPLFTAQELIQRQIQEHDETCVLAKQQGYYTWGAAFRQSFGLVRREFVQE
jgi:hypothetical protein